MVYNTCTANTITCSSIIWSLKLLQVFLLSLNISITNSVNLMSSAQTVSSHWPLAPLCGINAEVNNNCTSNSSVESHFCRVYKTAADILTAYFPLLWLALSLFSIPFIELLPKQLHA